jgi:hypothetical protein
VFNDEGCTMPNDEVFETRPLRVLAAAVIPG